MPVPSAATELPAQGVDVAAQLTQIAEALEARTASMEVQLEHVITIEQAKGMLAARWRCSIARAAAELEHAAAAADVPVHEFAAAIVAERRPEPRLR